MKIVGCDLHTRYQQIAMVDSETGELIERRLEHAQGEARSFYAGLQGRVAHNCLHLAIAGVSKSCQCPLLLARTTWLPHFPTEGNVGQPSIYSAPSRFQPATLCRAAPEGAQESVYVSRSPSVKMIARVSTQAPAHHSRSKTGMIYDLRNLFSTDFLCRSVQQPIDYP